MKQVRLLSGVLLCLFTLLVGPALPQRPRPKQLLKESLPTVDEVLHRYVSALGGSAAIRQFSNLVLVGTVEMPGTGLSGEVHIISEAPNKVAIFMEVPQVGTISEAFDGYSGWEQNPKMGVRTLSQEEIASLQRDSDFYRDLRLRELYSTMTVRGKVKYPGGEAYLVEARHGQEPVEKMYFDTNSGLLVRWTATRPSPVGHVPAEFIFSDYRPVDGVMVPFTVRHTYVNFTMLFRFKEAKHNLRIDPEIYARPY